MAVIFRTSILTLVLLAASAAAGDPGPDKENGPPPAQLEHDFVQEPIKIRTPHRFAPFHKKTYKEAPKDEDVPELQVGCGDGSLKVKPSLKDIAKKDAKKSRHKRSARQKKSYWSSRIIEAPSLTNFGIWQPQSYELNRPYYIPVWGAPGQIPIYFPPQPLYYNPGYPIDNPPKPLVPNREYLPPKTTTQRTEDTTVTLIDKFRDESTPNTPMTFGQDERPIWGTSSGNNRPNRVRTTTQTTPTRKPPAGPRSTHPPIVRDSSSNNGMNVNQLSPQTPSTPFLIEEDRPEDLVQAQTARPVSSEPSRCVWAIVSCCSVASSDVNYSCFEQLGCPGAFWDTKPCEGEIARAAIDKAMNYYNSK